MNMRAALWILATVEIYIFSVSGYKRIYFGDPFWVNILAAHIAFLTVGVVGGGMIFCLCRVMDALDLD